MNELNVNIRLGKAPATYDQREMDRIIRDIEKMLRLMVMPGEITVTQVYADDLPISDDGLKKGQLWYDETERVVRIA
jgi:hypothetical protein